MKLAGNNDFVTPKSSKFDKKANLHFSFKIWQKTLENSKNLNFDLEKQEKVIKLEKKLIISAYFPYFFPLFWCIRVLYRDDGAL